MVKKTAFTFTTFILPQTALFDQNCTLCPIVCNERGSKSFLKIYAKKFVYYDNFAIFADKCKINTLCMTKKPRISKQKAISEILKGLRIGMSYSDIHGKIEEKWELSQTSFYRYTEEAQEKHTQEQQEVQRVAREQLIQAKKEELKSDIISIQKRKEYLTKVVTAETDLIQVGKATVEVLTHDDGRREIITNDIRIRALQELNRMDGAYTPTQFEDVTERKPLHEIFNFTENDKDKDK